MVVGNDAGKGRISPVDEAQLLRAAACDWRLSRGDIGVFAVILEHCDAELRSFPGPALIAKRARLSVTSVKSSIRQLEQWRYVEIERPGLRKRNKYRVLPSPTVLPRVVATTTRQMGLPSAGNFQRGNWSRGVSQSSQRVGHATGQAQRHPTGQACLQQLGKRARQEVAFEGTTESTTPAAPLASLDEQQRQQEVRRAYRDEYQTLLKTDPERARRFGAEATVRPHILDLLPLGPLREIKA